MEDIYVTGLCARACRLVRYHDPGFLINKVGPFSTKAFTIQVTSAVGRGTGLTSDLAGDNSSQTLREREITADWLWPPHPITDSDNYYPTNNGLAQAMLNALLHFLAAKKSVQFFFCFFTLLQFLVWPQHGVIHAQVYVVLSSEWLLWRPASQGMMTLPIMALLRPCWVRVPIAC